MAPNLPDPATSAAFLFGTSIYRDPRLTHLPGVVNNVIDLASVLSDSELWGLPAERCSTLLDMAYASELMEPLSRLADQARDTFIVYYAGHGLLTREGDLMLATTATDADLPKFTALPYAWVRDVVGRCRATRRIVVLDCCFSGRALRAMSDPATAVIGQVDVDGIYVLTSAPATSPSLAPEEARYTAFTGGLLHILLEGIPGGAEVLSLDDVYDSTLLTMARLGWPRPQRMGTNAIGRLGLLRNNAWRASPPARFSQSFPDPGRWRRLADGVRRAVAVVAVALGPKGDDGLDVLGQAFPRHGGETEKGVELVRETMLTMREQYGDGATTAAVILGCLVEGLATLLDAGVERGSLEAAIEAETTRLAQHLMGRVPSAPATPSRDDLAAAVWTAVGTHELAEAVVDAASSVGAGNVEVAPSSADVPEGMQDVPPSIASAFVLETATLAPNAFRGPITLEDPIVVVSTDGEVDIKALLAAAGDTRPGALIIAPRVSIFTIRGLLHPFSQTVVVRPTDPSVDLAALRNRFCRGETGRNWGRARRALVLPTATTIDRPPADLQLSRNRLTLTITDPTRDRRMIVAIRALAVARSVADAGVVPGGGTALHIAAQGYDPERSLDPLVAELVRAAACEPHRRLQLAFWEERRGPNGVDPAVFGLGVDSLATVRGALRHAAATASRFLSAE